MRSLFVIVWSIRLILSYSLRTSTIKSYFYFPRLAGGEENDSSMKLLPLSKQPVLNECGNLSVTGLDESVDIQSSEMGSFEDDETEEVDPFSPGSAFLAELLEGPPLLDGVLGKAIQHDNKYDERLKYITTTYNFVLRWKKEVQEEDQPKSMSFSDLKSKVMLAQDKLESGISNGNRNGKLIYNSKEMRESALAIESSLFTELDSPCDEAASERQRATKQVRAI